MNVIAEENLLARFIFGRDVFCREGVEIVFSAPD